ncbi:SGNH/GDSL hydrolase family protein [Niabella yanshanensis]|uniref:SGNH/GDSL hydrolase family protein n=1 Tax=Niabella yanshanensis TaxID=577386 RepID=A0ABZ0W7T8_9BACT|nr:SGNH/GDSL hydrolase family protein [Niabella yanshanensis]WQD38734.1 SGNH/GDSL hydrolase family protein [Niabella yanshanensis]
MIERTRKILIAVVMLMVGGLLGSCGSSRQHHTRKNVDTGKWVGTWATAPQLVEPNNMPPEPGLAHNTIRQIVRVSMGGEKLRLRFSNAFSKEPVTMKTVAVAVAKEGSLIDPSTQQILKFNGAEAVTMPPSGEGYSDPLDFTLAPGSTLAITIYFGDTSPGTTGHPGSRTTSYLLAGNQIGSADFAGAVATDHWYVINSIEVMAGAGAFAIAALGNSITDGRGSGTNKQNRWTDILSQQLLTNKDTKNIGVLNLGIGGNCVLRGGLGPTALNRFDRDILSQSSVKWLLILEGINDIGGIRNTESAPRVARELIEAYSLMADKAHARGIKVYGCTILPFGESFYDTPFRQQARDTVNEWIRTTDKFDAVIDFDKIMRNAGDIKKINPDLHDGDMLHPNQAGYKKMGEAIDLNLFTK